jgi:hypothetical protein
MLFFYQIGQFLDSEVPPFYNLERDLNLELEEWGELFFLLNFFFYL